MSKKDIDFLYEYLKKIKEDYNRVESEDLGLDHRDYYESLIYRTEYKIDKLACFESMRSVIDYYVINPAAFIECECKIFNPELFPPDDNPFYLYKYQRDFINNDLYPAYLNGQSLLDEKTRQMGMSWVYCAFMLWGLLHDPGFSGFALSKKEALVDDGGETSTLDSLFGKIRYMYGHLSSSYVLGYKEKYRNKSTILKFKKLRIWNQMTNAYLVGSSANSDAGRGGTYKFAFWDETASTPKSETIFSAFKLAGKCKCYNSTVRGRGNVFSRLRWNKDSGVKVVNIHWTQHPNRIKNKKWDTETETWVSDWYLNECRDMTPEQIAQELDIDYDVSVSGRVYTGLNVRTHVTDVVWCDEWKERTIISWDLGVSDETFATIIQVDNQGNFLIVDELCGTDKEIRFYIDLIMGVPPKEFEKMNVNVRAPYEAFLRRSREREYRYLLNVAGADVVARSINSLRSVKVQFTTAGNFARDDNGVIVNRRYVNLRMHNLTGYKILDRIVEVKKAIDPTHNRVYFAKECVQIWERAINYKWAPNPLGGNNETPLHDEFSHGADSFGYGILYFTKELKIGIRPGNKTKNKGQSVITGRGIVDK